MKQERQTREIVIDGDGRVMSEAEKQAFYKERKAKMDAKERTKKPTAATPATVRKGGNGGRA